MLENVTESKHGGKRKNAGRKAKRGSTVVKRIPEKYLHTVNNLLDFLESSESKYPLDHIEKTIMVVLNNNY
jgi:hypothetical protein